MPTPHPKKRPSTEAKKRSSTEAPDASPLQWYKDGLRFQCTGCGDCCTGAPGYVWVNQSEITAMSNLLGIRVESFEAQYVRKVGIRRSLVELPNGDCIFFDSKSRHCAIYQVRPRQCRSWPFWKSNIKTPKTWENICDICPGSGKGKLHSLQTIQKHVDQMHV